MTSSYWITILLLIPLIGGLVAWWKFDEIVLWEWAASVGAALAVMALTFWITSSLGSRDQEIMSGYVYRANHTPKWHAEWEETESYTDEDGETQTRTVTKRETHYPKWWVDTTVGEIRVDEDKFNQIGKKFGIKKEMGYRPDFDYGDRFDYYVEVKNPDPALPVYPVHTLAGWSNPLLGTDTIKLGKPVSEEEAKKRKLFDYPSVTNEFHSARVLGKREVSTYRWDQMCAELGASYKVNLTLINFGDRDMADAVKQRDYWRNGRKNDLVLCYGNSWSYVFGWSKSELVKQELQSLLLDNKVNDALIPAIADVVKRDFKPYEWHKEEEVSRPVPTGAVVAAFILMSLSQVGIYFAFHQNSHTKLH